MGGCVCVCVCVCVCLSLTLMCCTQSTGAGDQEEAPDQEPVLYIYIYIYLNKIYRCQRGPVTLYVAIAGKEEKGARGRPSLECVPDVREDCHVPYAYLYTLFSNFSVTSDLQMMDKCMSYRRNQISYHIAS